MTKRTNPLALILAALFILMNSVLYAPQNAISQSSVSVAPANANENSKLPYADYKGIHDLSAAKEAWVKDHPEEYKALSHQNTQPAAPAQEAFVNYKGIKDLKQAKLEWLKDHPQTTNNTK